MQSVLLIWDRLGDYHRARANALRDAYNDGQLYTADLGAGDDLYRWEDTAGADTHFILSRKPVHRFDLFTRIRNFLKIERAKNVGILGIAGYGRIEYLVMIVLAKLTGRKTILFAESWYPGNKVIDWLKGAFLRAFVDGFFVSGTRAERHFRERLGIPHHKIRTGYSVVDNDHFRKTNINTPESDFPSTGQHVNPSTRPPVHPSTLSPYLLCVARYSPEKNLPFLIDAYRNSDLYTKWKLVIVGDGPDRVELQQCIRQDEEHMYLTGWKSYEDLPGWYHNAGAFVLPSLFEPWGLVVNEAMAAGLPVLVSDKCGCAPDLVWQENGRLFDPENQHDLEKALNQLREMTNQKIAQRGLNGLKRVKDYTPGGWSRHFLDLMK